MSRPGEVPPQLYDLLAESYKGSRQLGNPVPDLRKAQRTGSKITNNTYGPGGPRRNGPLGELSRHPALRAMSELKLVDGRLEEPLFTNEPMPNARQVHKRIVKPLAPDVCTVSRGELAFLRQNDPRNGNVVHFDHTMIQSNPQMLVNVAQWNALTVDEQIKMFKKDADEYTKMTPRDFYKNWKLEGVVESDGGAGQDLHRQTRSNKMINIISKGDASVNSYWNNPMPNSKCYILIKKYDLRPNFTLNSKRTGGGMGGYRQMTNNTDIPIKPFQMGFYCLTFGDQIPLEALQYTDEQGFTRSDTLAIYVGTVLRIPLGACLFDNSFVANDTDNPDNGHAYVDSNEGVSRANITALRLVMDPDDGVLPY